MKLAKALKEKKRLAADIAHLKNLIMKKNSRLLHSNSSSKFNIGELYHELQQKIQQLVNLKIIINEANKEIQPSIYLLGEYKALVSFFGCIEIKDGLVSEGYSEVIKEYTAQIDELKRDEIVKEYQSKADRLQDQIDTYNYTTEITWGDDLGPDNEKTN